MILVKKQNKNVLAAIILLIYRCGLEKERQNVLLPEFSYAGF